MADPTKPLVVKTETTPLISSSAPAPSNRVMGRTDHDTVQLQIKDVITVVAESAACIATCGLFGLCGMYTVGPRETILTLHNGRLTGIESQPGCHWAAACCRSMRAVTTQDIVWNMPLLKMLDIKGVPIQVSAILVYRVVDAKKAALDIDDYNSFVRSLSTAALKQVVQRYTYDELKVEARAISEQIVAELQTRVVVAGAQVDSMTLNELNYAPEIASAMLKKQQAGALIEARELISEGAVQISLDAVQKLEAGGRIQLTNEDKVKVVTNLLTICCGEENAKPVITL